MSVEADLERIPSSLGSLVMFNSLLTAELPSLGAENLLFLLRNDNYQTFGYLSQRGRLSISLFLQIYHPFHVRSACTPCRERTNSTE